MNFTQHAYEGRLHRLFEEARRTDRADQEAFLQRVCPNDETLRRQLSRALDRYEAPVASQAETVSSLFGPMTPEQLPHRYIGKKFGRYRLRSYIGMDDLGIRYEAKDTVLGIQVGLKALREVRHQDAVLMALLREKTDLLCTLAHPHIVPLFAFREDLPIPALLTAAPEGVGLPDHLEAHGPLPWTVAVPLFIQLLDAVAYAQDQGLHTPELLPTDLLLTEDETGRPVMLIRDYGLPKRPFADRLLLQEDVAFPPLAYRAPEYLQDHPRLDARTDLYTLGVVYYQMLTGTLPWANPTDPNALAEAIRTGDTLPIDQQGLALPEALVAVITKALAPDPEARYAHPEALREALETIPLVSASDPMPAAPQEALPASAPDTPDAPAEPEPVALDIPAETEPVALETPDTDAPPAEKEPPEELDLLAPTQPAYEAETLAETDADQGPSDTPVDEEEAWTPPADEVEEDTWMPPEGDQAEEDAWTPPEGDGATVVLPAYETAESGLSALEGDGAQFEPTDMPLASAPATPVLEAPPQTQSRAVEAVEEALAVQARVPEQPAPEPEPELAEAEVEVENPIVIPFVHPRSPKPDLEPPARQHPGRWLLWAGLALLLVLAGLLVWWLFAGNPDPAPAPTTTVSQPIQKAALGTTAEAALPVPAPVQQAPDLMLLVETGFNRTPGRAASRRVAPPVVQTEETGVPATAALSALTQPIPLLDFNPGPPALSSSPALQEATFIPLPATDLPQPASETVASDVVLPDDAPKDARAAAESPQTGIYVPPDQMPQVIGGDAVIARRVSYPADALEAGIEGTVRVRFVVDENGNVQVPSVVKPLMDSLDREALRVVRSLTFQPGLVDGQPVKVMMVKAVHFRR